MQEKINHILDYSVYLQLMASFCNEINYAEFNLFRNVFNHFIENSSNEEIERELPLYEEKLNKYASLVECKYPTKVDFRIIAKEWSNLLKNDSEVLNNGIHIGWLEQFLDLNNFYKYDYYPYHFKIGLVTNKGKGDIEDNQLLRDSFKCLYKAEKYFNILKNFDTEQKEIFRETGKTNFDEETLSDLNTIKFEILFFSRLAVISFYSFFECFVNSIGFDFYYRRKNDLTERDREILKGTKKGNFINLKFKIESFQKIIRKDKNAKIVLSDKYQIPEPFRTIFNTYEDLRNSAVHHSPEKTKIWISPDDWYLKAVEFSKLTMEASKIIWQICHETDKGADYLGRFNYKKLYDITLQSETRINVLEKQWLRFH